MSTATGVLVPLMPAHGGKRLGPMERTTRAQAAQLQNEARGVSSEPIVSAVESCDCFRGIENLNCVAYAKAGGTPTDARAKQ